MNHAHATVTGMVQGVGFRPFLHRLAAACAVTGWARNTPEGVELEVTGVELDGFFRAIRADAPPLSRVAEIRVQALPDCAPFASFAIRESAAPAWNRVLLTPDLAICPDCLRELRSPGDRRFGYPFLNCTNCGPRYTIVRALPYDRARTTMASFPMCPACAAEYGDIASRRYHAQPTCCERCGPRATYYDAAGAIAAGDAVGLAAAALRDGGIVLVKGIGGMHLCCTAEDEKAVRRLRGRKFREEKPLAVMCRDRETVLRLCEADARELEILESPAHPIVLLRSRSPMPWLGENGQLGVMLPYTPLHFCLLAQTADALVMTSANAPDCPVITADEEALAAMRGVADGFLLYNREIAARCDDSLCRVVEGEPYFIRRSRGYVPTPIENTDLRAGILACGAEQKGSYALTRAGMAFCSPHIGDLKNMETLTHYTQSLAHMQALAGVTPRMAVCDLHPDFLSTAYARQTGLPLLQVQHHWAHMASCMADNGLSEPCIGVIWDGTGLGTDGTIWGAEWLVGDFSGFTRMGSIEPIRLPGGDRAAEEIGRVASSLRCMAGLDDESDEPWRTLLRSGRNCPASSGMGRLFDGVFALLTGRRTVSYEGQAASLLEAMASGGAEAYPVRMEGMRFRTAALVRDIAEDLARGTPRAEIAMRFHQTLIRLAAAQVRRIADEVGRLPVVLSGGSFQNQILLRGVCDTLRAAGFRVYHHRRVAPNDEGIALGQAAIAGRSEIYVSGAAAEDYRD